MQLCKHSHAHGASMQGAFPGRLCGNCGNGIAVGKRRRPAADSQLAHLQCEVHQRVFSCACPAGASPGHLRHSQLCGTFSMHAARFLGFCCTRSSSQKPSVRAHAARVPNASGPRDDAMLIAYTEQISAV